MATREQDITIPMFSPEAAWEVPRLDDLPEWDNVSVVGTDCETRDVGLNRDLGIGVRFEGSFLVGISFCLDGERSYYLPIAHEKGPDNLDPNKVRDYLCRQFRKFTGVVVGANLKYDLDYLIEFGIEFNPAITFRDVLVNAPIIYELEFEYGLDAVAKRLGLEGKEEELLKIASSHFGFKKPKEDLWRLPAKYVGPYAEADALLPVQILKIQEAIIEKENLGQVYELESKVIMPLVKMTRRGVKVDPNRLAWVDHWAKEEQEICHRRIADITGIVLGPGDCTTASAIIPILDYVGCAEEYTAKGQRKTSDGFLSRYEGDPVIDALRRARRFDKISTMYVKPTIEHLTKQMRIHPTFNQLKGETEGEEKGTITGRLSCSDTNLQQQPSRDPEIAPIWRSIYLPDKEYFCCCDYSQQEPRLMTHYAELTKDKWGKPFPGAKEAADAYRNNPDMDFHQMMSDVTGLPRKAAKQIFLGLCYGMGGGKLCDSLGLPTEPASFKKNGIEIFYDAAGPEGQKIIDQFKEKAPFVPKLQWRVKDKVKNTGSIRTLLGRRRNFPVNDKTGEVMWLHKALNSLIQGSAADQTKFAMVELDRAGFELQLQVHDEIDLSIDTIQEGRDMKEIMENCVPLQVPSRVDLEIGSNWGNVEEVA